MQRTMLDGEDSATPRRPDDEIDWGDHVDQAPHRDRYRGSTSPGRKTLAWAVVVALVVGAAAVGYVYWSPQREGAQPEAAAPSRTAPEAAPERDAGPAIQHPIEDGEAPRAETSAAAPLPRSTRATAHRGRRARERRRSRRDRASYLNTERGSSAASW